MVHKFIISNYIDIILVVILFFVFTAKVIPPQYAGTDKYYYDQHGNKKESQKACLIEALTNMIFFTLFKSLMISITMKGTITLLLFIIVGVELYFSKTISLNAVIVSSIGIIALYFEGIVVSAKELHIWKIFKYISKD
jgi:hypothetical protein